MTNDLIDQSPFETTGYICHGCGVETATKLARVLLGSYPREPHEPEVYTRAIVSVLAEQPLEIAKRAVDVVTRRLQFLPTRADLCTAIDEIIKERNANFSVKSRASEQIKLHEKYKAEQDAIAADRLDVKNKLGPSFEDWQNLPILRRYSGSLENFVYGWTQARDKRAFCDSWGLGSQNTKPTL